MTQPLAARFLQGLGEAAKAPLGLAVSGGGDSMALLRLAHDAGLRINVVTVDHGLRPEAAAEAAMVAASCATLGVPHETLRWQGWDGKGNLPDAARRARRELIADWARRVGLNTVVLGHTRDDVAETFLMRLGRGAGVDGLAMMRAEFVDEGIRWCRPLLQVGRMELRGYLRGLGQLWAEDPSNEDQRYERSRARRVMTALEPLGLGVDRIAEVAGLMAEARNALEMATDFAARRCMIAEDGDVRLIPAAFEGEPAEIQRRLLLRTIRWIAPGNYDPRGSALMRLVEALTDGRGGMLAGVRMVRHRGTIVATRELRAVGAEVSGPDAVWDRRWCVKGPWVPGVSVRALGPEGLSVLTNWRDMGRPRAAMLTTPAVWNGTKLLAAPLAGFANGWAAISLLPATTLFSSAIAH